MPKLIRNARLSPGRLHKNEAYIFSARHALSVYPINAIYSFVPKNACSTLRFSIAKANGFLQTIEDVSWIHKNNHVFVATQYECARAEYVFIVLRCPYRRLASCYLDKFASGKRMPPIFNSFKFTFTDFCRMIYKQPRAKMNHHWRNQSDFLHYEEYDNYFSVEDFSSCIESLLEKGITITDTRTEVGHSLTNLQSISGNFSEASTKELKTLKESGQAPTYQSLYCDETIELVSKKFEDDLDLYSRVCSRENLLFQI